MVLPNKTVIHVYGGSPKKRGSLEEYFLLLTSELRNNGWRSLFYFNNLPSGDLLQAYLDVGAELRPMRTTLSRLDMGLIRAFRREFRRENPAVVNVHFGNTCINALIAARLGGIKKRVWTKHSLDAISYRGDLQWHKRRLHTINYEALWTTDIVAVSQAVKNELASHSITDKVRQFYLGVDRQRFVSGMDVCAKREVLGVKAGQSVVACISQARPEKGIEFLVHAIARLKDEPCCPYFLIVGGGPLTRELEKLADELGVASLINFCGVRNDVEDILALASFTVLPSLEEAAGLVIMESFSAGKPVIASRVGGIPELVRHGVNGILIEPGNSNGFATAIKGLLLDSERLRMLCCGATASAEQYDIKMGVEETIDLYFNGGAK